MNAKPSKRFKPVDDQSARELSEAFSRAIKQSDNIGAGLDQFRRVPIGPNGTVLENDQSVNSSYVQFQQVDGVDVVVSRLSEWTLHMAQIHAGGYHATYTVNGVEVAHETRDVITNVILIDDYHINYLNMHPGRRIVRFPFNYSTTPRKLQLYGIGDLLLRSLRRLRQQPIESFDVQYPVSIEDNFKGLGEVGVRTYDNRVHGLEGRLPLLEFDASYAYSQFKNVSMFVEGMTQHMALLSWMVACAMPFALHPDNKQFREGLGLFNFNDIDNACPLIDDPEFKWVKWYANNYVQGFDFADMSLKKWGPYIGEIDPAPKHVDDLKTFLFNRPTDDVIRGLMREIENGFMKTLVVILKKNFAAQAAAAQAVVPPASPDDSRVSLSPIPEANQSGLTGASASFNTSANSSAPSTPNAGITGKMKPTAESIGFEMRPLQNFIGAAGGRANLINVTAQEIMATTLQHVEEVLTATLTAASRKYHEERARADHLQRLYGDINTMEAKALKLSMLEDIRMYIMGNENGHFLVARLLMCVSNFVREGQFNSYLETNVTERIYEALALRRSLHGVLRAHPVEEKNNRMRIFLERNNQFLDARIMKRDQDYYTLLNEVAMPSFCVALASVYTSLKVYIDRVGKTKQAAGVDFLFTDKAVRVGAVPLFANVIARKLILSRPNATSDMRTAHIIKTLEINMESAWDDLKNCIIVNKLLD
jgi:hypothetical protein